MAEQFILDGEDAIGEPPVEETESEESKEESTEGKSKKGKKKKKKKNPEKTKFLEFMALIVVILGATAYFGFKLINEASYLGILVIVAGLGLAIFLVVANMVRLKLYERVKARTKKNEEQASVKLDEEMEKCKNNIAALDERAAERAKDAPAEKK